jgi:transcriptional regulator with XRE-family HTH domain
LPGIGKDGTEMSNIEIGERIRLRRIELGLSQEQLAEQMDCSNITISSWELGKCDIKSSRLIKLSEVLHMSADIILGIGKKSGNISEFEVMYRNLSDTNKIIFMNTMTAMLKTMSEN